MHDDESLPDAGSREPVVNGAPGTVGDLERKPRRSAGRPGTVSEGQGVLDLVSLPIAPVFVHPALEEPREVAVAGADGVRYAGARRGPGDRGAA